MPETSNADPGLLDVQYSQYSRHADIHNGRLSGAQVGRLSWNLHLTLLPRDPEGHLATLEKLPRNEGAVLCCLDERTSQIASFRALIWKRASDLDMEKYQCALR